MDFEDDELIRRIASRDERALVALHNAYYRRLTRFLLRMSRRPDIVAEVINDVLLTIWSKADTFRGDSKPSTWIIGIAYRRALKALEKDRRQAEVVDPNLAPIDLSGVERDLDLDATMAGITADQRAVVELAYFFGYSYREIAKMLDCSENTVKTRMHRARAALRSQFEMPDV